MKSEKEDTTSTAAAADFCNGIFDNEVERCCITDESIAVRFERSNLLQTKDSSGNFCWKYEHFCYVKLSSLLFFSNKL